MDFPESKHREIMEQWETMTEEELQEIQRRSREREEDLARRLKENSNGS